jgi:phospholipase C
VGTKPSFPNRLYWQTGTIDPNSVGSGPILSNEVITRIWRTYAQNLTEAGSGGDAIISLTEANHTDWMVDRENRPDQGFRHSDLYLDRMG